MKIEMILIFASASFLGTWIAWYYLKRRSSMTIRIGGGFIVAVLALASFIGVIGVVIGGGNAVENQSGQQVQVEYVPPQAPVVRQNYSMRDGYEYGYEMALSQAAVEQGQAATTLMMFRYHGSLDGKYQVSTTDGDDVISTIECSNPCEFMKVIVSSKAYGHIKTERLRAVDGAVGTLAITDAINGKMDQYVGEKSGRKYTVWVDEKKGIIKTTVN